MERCLISDKLGEFPHIFWQDMAQEFGVSQELCNRENELTQSYSYIQRESENHSVISNSLRPVGLYSP